MMIREQTLGESGTVGRVISALPEAVLAVSFEDRVLEINPPAQALFPGLRIGAPLARILRSPDILDAITHARLSGKPSRASWLERVPVERLFEVNVSPVDGLDVGPMLIIYFREISETRRFERMRIDFVANASHELRTPLASLLGFIETLQGPARNDASARTRFLAIMREQAQRMARLVDDLLSLSRIEQHLHLQPRQPVDLALVLHHIVDTLGPLADDNGVTVTLDAETPVIVSGDRDELLRVAENLIENAIKYGASDGEDKRVEVSASLDDGDGVITVRDFGPGIAAEHLPRLTERFYRIDAGASRAKGGTGLGLAIVKHIVARHRGRLKIESTEGSGAVFRVLLPLHNS
ncbi:MAG: ATP-binding protein [Beijerinckiaceae bacterium]|jgi:two-component system phosphate regulon sensor histidine kinase PhoR